METDSRLDLNTQPEHIWVIHADVHFIAVASVSVRCEFAPHTGSSLQFCQNYYLPFTEVCRDPHKWSRLRQCRWPWRDLNTQPSDLESDALPLRHKVTVLGLNSPTKTWHHSHTGALVTYCGCVCMCTPKKPYSESTMFRLYSLWIYN